MPGVVVPVGEDYNLLYGSEVWGIVQGAYAQYALAPCSLMTLKPFSFPLGKIGTIPIAGETSCSVHRMVVVNAGQVARVSLEPNWSKFSAREL